MELSKALILLLSSVATFASATDTFSLNRHPPRAGNSDDARDGLAVSQKQASRKGPQTEGVCWNHSEGSICQGGDSFKGVSISGDEILIQELHGDGKLYSYRIQNEEKFRNDLDKVPIDIANKKLSHVIAELKQPKPNKKEVKYDCKVEDVGEEFRINERNKHTELLESNDDGTSLWLVNSWHIMVDSDMNPISIELPNEEGIYEFSTSIKRVDKFSVNDLEGCDPETEGDEDPEPSVEDVDLYFELLNAENPSISDDDFISGVGHRHLDWITDFSAVSSNTQWCGRGTNIYSTPCPDKNKKFDFWADNACRRHDHGKIQKGTNVPRLECAVDNDLRVSTSNWAVQGAYGKW
eukprot:CAMPEP_0183735232 /NCGR_PEP_ID=MMETSP0737-20130205/46067_1 /TAXON_ID=385413 /ORGANISM="Thalassiosira miniscula, Strain CCMP1093" /LENGTH=351 /DNA_ID=CAMNT_0025968909 /DNA_START=182 /DNA_END=1234 /DNA_ORIENTATION=+